MNKLRLSIFAGYVSQIMISEVGEFRVSLGSRVVHIKIDYRGDLELDRVWDQVWIDGRWCGNRHGGVKGLTDLVIDMSNDGLIEMEMS